MMEFRFAVSKAGHDRGKLFFIVREEENAVYLADGKTRTAANPKRKNKKHIQPVKCIPGEVQELLRNEKEPDDVTIKRAIKLCQKNREAKTDI